MALIMSFHKGEEFYVDDDKLVVEDIFAEGHFRLGVGPYVYDIVDDSRVEVVEDVWVSVGDRAARVRPRVAPGTIRVSIDAPRSKLILRGSNYRGATT